MKPKLIVGLGNPGPQYAFTRHNVGFWFVDRLVEQYQGSFRAVAAHEAEVAKLLIQGEPVYVVKPLSFMNRSGESVQKIAHFYRIPITAILIVHDDLDLSPGVARLKRGGGHGGHNGLRDIHRTMGAEYDRLRIGIGHPGVREKVIGFVLDRPDPQHHELIMSSLYNALNVMEDVLSGNWDSAVRCLHARKSKVSGSEENL